MNKSFSIQTKLLGDFINIIASLKLFREHNGSSAKVAGASSASAKLKLDASSWSAVKTQGAKSEVHKVYSSRM